MEKEHSRYYEIRMNMRQRITCLWLQTVTQDINGYLHKWEPGCCHKKVVNLKAVTEYHDGVGALAGPGKITVDYLAPHDGRRG